MSQNIYIKWFEGFLLPLIVTIGIAYWSITQNNMILLYILIGSFFYLLFLFILNERRIRRERDKTFIRDGELIKDTGFRYNDVQISVEVGIDGSMNETRYFELEVLEGVLSSKDYHIVLVGDKKFEDYQVEVKKIEGEKDVSFKIIGESSQNKSLLVEFSPALIKGDKIIYEISEVTGKNLFIMTKDELLKNINEGKWPFDQPYEYYRYQLTSPAKKLSLTTILPKEYKITTKDVFWDVVVGHSSSRNSIEFERLYKENSFSKEIVGDKQVLKLVVNEPKIFLGYMTKWKPPNKEEYKKLLNRKK